MTAANDLNVAEQLTGDGAELKESVREVYDFIADECEERIPGVTPADRRFIEIETDFVLGKIRPTSAITCSSRP